MTTNGEARPVERWQGDVIGDVCGPRLEMVLHPLGEYVKFADYECVLHQRDDLEQKLLSSRQQCSGQMAGNEMLRSERYSAADYEALRTELEVSDRNLVDAMSVIAKFDELQEAAEEIIFACDAYECDVVPFNKHRGGIRRLRSALKALNEAGEG